MRHVTIAAFLLTLLAACAQPTPYQRAANGFGFSEQRIEDNRYRIVFSGNNVTPKQVVEDYMLFRAAEITLANGYEYFVIADRNVDKSTQYYATFTDTGIPYYDRRFYPYYYDPPFQTYSGTYRPIERFTASANVLLYRGRKPAGNAEAYDAREVEKQLGPTIRRPTPPAP